MELSGHHSPAKSGYTDLNLAQVSPSHTRTSQAVGHMIHPAVHDADNISFGLEAMRTMITEGYSTSTVQSAAPTYMQHILIQHDGARQLTQ
jgi:hypothetical protein